MVTSSPELQYSVSFATAREYVVWVRGAATNAAGDSLHIGLNGAVATTADNLTGFHLNEWGWSAATMDGVTATLTIPTPGVYTVTVWAREDGVRVDRLLLTTDTAYLPSRSGPAESVRTGGGQALLLPAPDSQVTTALTVNPEYARQVARAERLALVWANILANPGGLAMAPLALIAPFAANPRRKRKSEWAAALSLAVVLFGVSLALLNGGMMMGGMPGGVADVYAAPEMATSNSTIDYSYDPLYRLTNASYDTGGSFGYSYDAAGNRLESQIDGTPVMSYTYDVANRLVQTNDLVASILAHYSYDDNGNLLADGEYSYS